MPIYEYVCGACHHTLEAFQGIKDPELKDCPECHQAALTRLVSAAAFRLKGSGWYETDFKKDSDKKKNLVNTQENTAPTVSEPATSNTTSKGATHQEPVKNSGKDQNSEKTVTTAAPVVQKTIDKD